MRVSEVVTASGGRLASGHSAAQRRLRWLLLALAAVAVLALSTSHTAAAPDGKIVVHGANSASHLRLTVNGKDIVVDGVTSGEPIGCQSGKPLTCPTAGVASIEIIMGPAGDKVEVLDKLPIPLTVHLGAGSDKFIGNGERDTCYSEGAKRNRCYGGAGDDICITGQKNSDCVGDGGDDYCRHGAGSDGCWGDCFYHVFTGKGKGEDPCQGKPGDDTCVMGPGQDGCHGGAGDDRLYEGTGTGKLYGERGHDFCDGGPGVGRSTGCEAGPGD